METKISFSNGKFIEFEDEYEALQWLNFFITKEVLQWKFL